MAPHVYRSVQVIVFEMSGRQCGQKSDGRECRVSANVVVAARRRVFLRTGIRCYIGITLDY